MIKHREHNTREREVASLILIPRHIMQRMHKNGIFYTPGSLEVKWQHCPLFLYLCGDEFYPECGIWTKLSFKSHFRHEYDIDLLDDLSQGHLFDKVR